MKETLFVLFAVIITVPYALTILLFMLMKMSKHTSVKSFRIAADTTVPFLFISDIVLLRMIFDIRMDIWLTCGILVIAIVYAIVERMRRKDFRVQLLFRNLWRMIFLLFSIALDQVSFSDKGVF